MTTSTILSDNGATSGSAGLKTTGGNDGTLVIQTTTAGGTATTAVTVDTSQNMTVAGNLTLNNGAADGAQLTLSSSGYSNWNWDNYSGRLRAYYNVTEYFTIDTSGNVGIGTSSPQTRLHAFSSATTTTVSIQGSLSAGANTPTLDFTGNNGGYSYGARIQAIRDTSAGGYSLAFGTTTNNAAEGSAPTEQARIDTSGNFKFNSGYGSVATAYGCRAWVNFNGTGTVAIRASGNVSSITDNGTGDYTVNFTTAMPDANYAANFLGSDASWGSVAYIYSYSSSSIRIITLANAGTSQNDLSTVCISIFR